MGSLVDARLPVEDEYESDDEDDFQERVAWDRTQHDFRLTQLLAGEAGESFFGR